MTSSHALADALVAFTFSTNAYGANRSVVNKRNLGNGFQLVAVEIDLAKCKDCSESVAHYHQLWFRSRRLSEMVGEYSLSPSKRFAVFEDVGELMLFDVRSEKLTNITDGAFAVPSEFRWDEAARRVNINYYGDHAHSMVKLPQ